MNGLDLLQSCSTNVRVVEEFFPPILSRWETREDGSSVHSALATLREERVLCAAADTHQVWVFGAGQAEAKLCLESLRYECTMSSGSAAAVDMMNDESSVRLLKDALLAAIEGSISFALARQQAMLHVSAWMWLFCSSSDEGEREAGSVLIRLYVNLTANGSLYIATTTESCSLQPMRQDLVAGSAFILAPSGRNACLPADDIAAAIKTKPAAATESWRQNVTRVLAADGTVILEGESWTPIEVREGNFQECVLWPTRLCLTIPSNSRNDKDWRRWFATSADDSHETFQNPLAAAEELFIAASEQDATHQQPESGLDDLPMSTSAMVAETPLTTSSPFNQRTIDHQAAMSGIYPTPPDGLIAAQLTTQTSASDAPLQPESSHDLSQFPDSDEHGHSFGSSTGPQGYQPSSDDLFGDMEQMEFGANAVADEDFDYFDEPDDIAVELEADDAVGADVEMEENVEGEAEEMEDVVGEDPMEEVPSAVPDITAPVDVSGPDVDDEGSGGDPSLDHEVETMPEPQEKTAKPLSPFGIRERLLPPPIPASATQRPANELRRSSTFDPVTFNEGLDLSVKYSQYASTSPAVNHSDGSQKQGPNIGLPQKKKKPRLQKPASGADASAQDSDSSSDEDSYEDSSDMSEGESFPPKLPWDTRKRKRGSSVTDLISPVYDDIGGNRDEVFMSAEKVKKWIDVLSSARGVQQAFGKFNRDLERSRSTRFEADVVARQLPKIEELFELTKLDLVYTAQVISEQAITMTDSVVTSVNDPRHSNDPAENNLALAMEELIGRVLHYILPSINDCNLTRLAAVKEPQIRAPGNPHTTPQTPHLRSHQRENSFTLGPDCFPIPSPYVRIQRGAVDVWEMLPPALSFWTALGLGPVNGPKDTRAICIIPNAEDVAGLVEEFLDDLGRVYESCKLGSFNFWDMAWLADLEEMEGFEGGMLRVGVESTLDLAALFKVYAAACMELGRVLARIGHLEPEKTIVVYMIDAFEEFPQARQYLCASFWWMYKEYRDHAPKSHRSLSRSDLVLQILPISLLAAPDGVVLPSVQQMGALAVNVYDRCPPSSKAVAAIDSTSSSLPILAAPAVELTTIPSKSKFIFQHSVEPPGVFNEFSVLHVAYAVSGDGQWISFCCMDGSGRYQKTSSACMRGKSFRDMIAEVWDKTLEVLAAREVMWRVFITASTALRESARNCWRNVIAMKPRKQVTCVTLLSVEANSSLRLTPPAGVDNAPSAGHLMTPGGGFLTPASTPQGTNISASPDASGGQTYAPPTPAPSDTTANIAEHDPDAVLVDITDESWGVVLSPSYTTPASEAVVSGVLFRAGEPGSTHLDSLGVSLYWDIRVKPNGIVDDVPLKQVEGNFRDVLKFLRNLCLFTKIRELEETRQGEGKGGGVALLPVHVLCAVRAAEALDRFLE